MLLANKYEMRLWVSLLPAERFDAHDVCHRCSYHFAGAGSREHLKTNSINVLRKSNTKQSGLSCLQSVAAYNDGGLNPPFMKEIFMQGKITYSLRHGEDAHLPKARTTSFGVESIAYLGKKLWQTLPPVKVLWRNGVIL